MLIQISGLRTRHLPSQPVPRLHLAEIRPFARARYGHGGWRTSRTSFIITYKERPGVQAIRAQTARVQILAFGYASSWTCIFVQLERDLQSASLLAGIGGVLVDPGLPYHEKADSEHDQVQVGQDSAGSVGLVKEANIRDRYVPWDFGKTKYSAK